MRCVYLLQMLLLQVAVQLEINVTMWGKLVYQSDITIGDGAVIQAQSGMAENIPAGKTFFGTPARVIPELKCC